MIEYNSGNTHDLLEKIKYYKEQLMLPRYERDGQLRDSEMEAAIKYGIVNYNNTGTYPGLALRRDAEANLFLKGVYADAVPY